MKVRRLRHLLAGRDSGTAQKIRLRTVRHFIKLLPEPISWRIGPLPYGFIHCTRTVVNAGTCKPVACALGRR